MYFYFIPELQTLFQNKTVIKKELTIFEQHFKSKLGAFSQRLFEMHLHFLSSSAFLGKIQPITIIYEFNHPIKIPIMNSNPSRFKSLIFEPSMQFFVLLLYLVFLLFKFKGGIEYYEALGH